MGKKKSVVLMVIITIVLVALTVFTVSPSFWFPWENGKDGWNGVTSFVDFGSDFNGGYYAYYYPEGVKSAAQYKNDLEGKTEDEQAEFADGYLQYKGLYLSKDEDFGMVKNGAISVEFKETMAQVRKVMAERFSAKGYASFRVSVVDDFALKVELSAAEALYESTFDAFSNFGAITMKIGETEIEELTAEDVNIRDYITGFAVGTQYSYNYLQVSLTKAGKELIGAKKDTLSASSAQDTATTLYICVGDENVPVYSDNVLSDNSIKCAYLENENKAQLETIAILLNSALQYGELDVAFADVTSEIRGAENIYGKGGELAILLILAALTVASIVVSIVKFRRFGVISAYMTLSYLVITTLCFAFISGGVFEFTLGTALLYLLGLVLMNVLHGVTYNAIKAEFDLGKTVDSSVTMGYKKTLMLGVDVYVVLVLAALAMFIATGGVAVMAAQALICFVAAAFCNLLWGRFINYLYLSCQKNKYQYFGFVREDDDDE